MKNKYTFNFLCFKFFFYIQLVCYNIPSWSQVQNTGSDTTIQHDSFVLDSAQSSKKNLYDDKGNLVLEHVWNGKAYYFYFYSDTLLIQKTRLRVRIDSSGAIQDTFCMDSYYTYDHRSNILNQFDIFDPGDTCFHIYTYDEKGRLQQYVLDDYSNQYVTYYIKQQYKYRFGKTIIRSKYRKGWNNQVHWREREVRSKTKKKLSLKVEENIYGSTIMTMKETKKKVFQLFQPESIS